MKRILLGMCLAAVSLAAPGARAEDMQPQYGGTLTFAVNQGDPDTYDCHATNSIATMLRVSPSYSLLVRFNERNYPEVIGDLAESWTVSDDGLTYTFKLHDGVMFHDGTALTSADIVASFDRIRKPPEGIVSPRSARLRDIDTITAPDEHTVVMALSKPNPSILVSLANPYNCVYSAAKLAEDPNWPATNVMGTGPFKFTRHDVGSEWVAQKFEGYFREGRPYLDELHILNMPPPAAVNAMSAGQIDMIFPALTPSDVDRIKSARGDAVQAFDAAFTTVMFVSMFNTQHPPFDDVRVRQALNLAIDRRSGSEALSKITSSSGFGTFMRPGSAYARPDEEVAKLPGFEPDMEARRARARELLKEAGQENLKFTYTNWSRYASIGVFLIDQWRQIGVEVEHEVLEVAPYFAKQKAGSYDAIFGAIVESSDDPSLRFAREISFSKNPTNLTRGDDAEFDALFEQQARELDPEKRADIARQMEDRLLENAAIIPLFWSKRPFVLASKVHGVVTPPPPAADTGLDRSEIWIEH